MSEMQRGFEHAVDKYAEALEAYVDRYDLPRSWFDQPDHLAEKCLDAEHYEDTRRTWSHRASLESEVAIDGRRLASVQLEEPISLGGFGAVPWLEIMEPRPEKIGLDRVGIDHAEFVFPSFELAARILRLRGGTSTVQKNNNHRWLNIVINQQDQELKFNDRPLADIVASEIETGEAYVL